MSRWLLVRAGVPEGDRGANAIRLVGGGNLHATWDRLLGDRASPNEVRRRVVELGEISVWLNPEPLKAMLKACEEAITKACSENLP